jgi:regulator of protease activity HflC (stomatin/prohibitin superfamily)
MEDSEMIKNDDSDFEEEYVLQGTYSLEILIVIMVFVMGLIYFSSRFFTVIPAGHKGVYFSTLFGGTQLDEYYDEGFHLLLPIDRMIIYDTRIQEHQDTILGLTSDGLEVVAEVSFRYFPDYTRIGRLHKELGPNYLNTILIPRVTAITRDIISQYEVDGLYSTSRDSIQKNMTEKSQLQITDNYPIYVVDVVVRNIRLPKAIMDAISGKLEFEQEALEYDFRLDVERKEAMRRKIEARGIKVFKDTANISILQWEGINATKELAKSPNAKVVVIGTDSGDLPIILGGGTGGN